MCSPKDFHSLVATLFDQSLKACQAGILTVEALKIGFGCEFLSDSHIRYPRHSCITTTDLLETFLLPSLVTGLSFFATLLWTTKPVSSPVLDIILPCLSVLILRPPSSSDYPVHLHEAVISTVSDPLLRSLNHVQRLYPKRTDTNSLLSALKTRLRPARTDFATKIELETWCATPGGLIAALSHSLQQLLQWSVSPTAPLPAYDSRMFIMATSMLGAKPVLDALLNEADKYADTHPDMFLDVLTATICAPTAISSRRRPTLRHALHAAYVDAYELSKKDPAKAELIVRLHRRVNAHTATTVTGVAVEDLVQAVGELEGVVVSTQDLQLADAGDMLLEVGGDAGDDIDFGVLDGMEGVDADEFLGL